MHDILETADEVKYSVKQVWSKVTRQVSFIVQLNC